MGIGVGVRVVAPRPFFVCVAGKGVSGKNGLGEVAGKCREAKGTRRAYHKETIPGGTIK